MVGHLGESPGDTARDWFDRGKLGVRALSTKFPSTFRFAEDPHLRKLGTEQVLQKLCTPLSIPFLCERDLLIEDKFHSLFEELSCPLSHIF